MLRRGIAAAQDAFQGFRRAVGGNLATAAALILPAVALAAVGGVQLAYVVSVRAKTQDIADSAALMAAQQLQVSPTGASARAQAWTADQLRSLPASTTTTTLVTLLANAEVQVTIKTNTPSFFGPDLPVGGFNTTVASTAQALGNAPLCILSLSTDPVTGLGLAVKNRAQIASTCLVYANAGIVVSPSGGITAPQTESGGSASGPINQPALTNAAQVGDPFKTEGVTWSGSGCGPAGAGVSITANTIYKPQSSTSAVAYCSHITVQSGATLTFSDGEFLINYGIDVEPGATLVTQNATLFFGYGAVPNFLPGSTVNLSGRLTGKYAGFVLVTDRNQTTDFVLPSDPIVSATGAIYSPTAGLVLTGSATAAQASDWTVIVAKSIQLGKTTDSPSIQINSNYSSSPVPVPAGVGPIPGNGSRLVG